jgi:hypothetical protein
VTPDTNVRHVNSESEEASPVLAQFLDCVSQCMAQYPEAFGFEPSFLIQIYEAAISGKYGNFLCDSEQERRDLDGKVPCCWPELLRWAPKKRGLDQRQLIIDWSVPGLTIWKSFWLRFF